MGKIAVSVEYKGKAVEYSVKSLPEEVVSVLAAHEPPAEYLSKRQDAFSYLGGSLLSANKIRA